MGYFPMSLLTTIGLRVGSAAGLLTSMVTLPVEVDSGVPTSGLGNLDFLAGTEEGLCHEIGL